jgi:dCMP deaminase
MNHIEMMRLAEEVALQSVCKRAQVGAVLAYGESTYTGFNHVIGNPKACCENEDGKTKFFVLHAEMDALLQQGEDKQSRARPVGATLYVTRQPCIDCARAIVNAGISAVYYRDADDKIDGIEHLLAHGVMVNSGWLKEQMRAQTLERVQDKWADRWQSACDACPQRGDGVCCGGVR